MLSAARDGIKIRSILVHKVAVDATDFIVLLLQRLIRAFFFLVLFLAPPLMITYALCSDLSRISLGVVQAKYVFMTRIAEPLIFLDSYGSSIQVFAVLILYRLQVLRS